MKFNSQNNISGGTLLLRVLAAFLFITCGLSSPIGNTDMSLASPLMERESSHCVWGTCDGSLGDQCYRPDACIMSVLTWDHATYDRCAVCVCIGRGFNGNTNPVCVADVKCLQVQLGYIRDPCAKKRESSIPEITERQTSDITEISEAQTDDNLARDHHAAMLADFTNLDKRDNAATPEVVHGATPVMDMVLNLPLGSKVDPDILAKIKAESKAAFGAVEKRDESSAVEKRDNAVESEADIMSEFASIANLPLGSTIDPEIMAKIISKIRNTTKSDTGAITGTVSESEAEVISVRSMSAVSKPITASVEAAPQNN